MAASSPIRIVAVSGSPTAPSRTTALVREVATRLADAVPDAVSEVIELAPLREQLAAGVWRTELGPDAQAALEQVERADALVVGSPAYRAAYTGLFKLFFDHVGQYALIDRPIVLTATGGSDRHALLVEHQMRPLFGFFSAHTLPVGIYAGEADFTDYAVTSPELLERIEKAVERAAPFIGSRALPSEVLAG